jgi:4-amino-4-deoxy-L-arabinose transferase-like glycosyltransferase
MLRDEEEILEGPQSGIPRSLRDFPHVDQHAHGDEEPSTHDDATNSPNHSRRHLLQWLIALVIFCATLIRYYEPSHPTRHLCSIGYESLELACSLAHKGTFSDPFRYLETGPSAHVAPLFPAIVAVVIRIAGDKAEGAYIVQWLGAGVLALQLAFWPFLSRRLGMGFAAGVFAVVAFLFVGIVLLPMWEAFYMGLMLTALSYCTHIILEGTASWRQILITGLLWGITFLLNPVPLFVFLALLAWAWLSCRIERRKLLALLLIPAAVILPWLVRNYRVFNHFILIRDNLGLELAVSNNSCAPFWFWGSFHSDCFRNLHPDESLTEVEKVKELGEYTYNQQRLQEAITWIKANPSAFVNLSAERFVSFWFPTPTGNPFKDQRVSPQMLVIWFLALLSIPGLWLLWRRNRHSAGIILLWLALFPPIYYFIQYDVRYRYPILWATFLPGCFFITHMAEEVWKAFRPSTEN